MKLYAYERGDLALKWFGVRPEVHKHAKTDVPAVYRPSIKIHECNVETDKAGVLKMLNGEPVYQTLRTWSMKSSGALQEITGK